MRVAILLLLFLYCSNLYAQFAPQVGMPGSDAIAADDARIVGWATGCEVHRGYLNIKYPALGRVSFGKEAYATAQADGIEVVSLGDSGYATCTFSKPIRNGVGPDFVVFENGFLPGFLEFAYVEVSSDGFHFVRFPAVSLTQADRQVGAFEVLDAALIHNLAGKYVAGYGVPFDLQALAGAPGLDIQRITHVRVVDVVGSILPQIGNKDVDGRWINDPWPTPFETGGFDLDAIGVIHFEAAAIGVYPTLLKAGDCTIIIPESHRFTDAMLCDVSGRVLHRFFPANKNTLPVLKPGIYMLHLYGDNQKNMFRLLVQ